MEKDFDIVDEDLEEVHEGKHLRRLFFIIVLIIVLTIIYARYIGTSGLLVKEYAVKSNHITDTYNGFKIAHFSDFHYGRTTHLKELQNLVKDINKMKPDIIVFTGDFIDRDTHIDDTEMSKIIDELKKLNSTYGNYYVNGNHDNKFDKYYQMFDSAGFNNLNNTYDVIYNTSNETILISGLGTKKNTQFLNEAFDNKKYNYTINIMHYPDYMDDVENYNFDLVLAGHSHNGQITIPFYGGIITANNAKKYNKPHYKVNNTQFYISSGVGTSNFNFRLFNRPSYNLYRLIKK